MICSINQRDIDRRTPEEFRREQSAESAADDDDAVAGGIGHEPSGYERLVARSNPSAACRARRHART
jgi:hypothetical protein